MKESYIVESYSYEGYDNEKNRVKKSGQIIRYWDSKGIPQNVVRSYFWEWAKKRVLNCIRQGTNVETIVFEETPYTYRVDRINGEDMVFLQAVAV